MKDLLTLFINILVLCTQHKVGVSITVFIPLKVLFVVLLFRAVVFLSHFGPLFIILIFQNFHSLLLLIHIVFLHNQEVNQVFRLSTFYSLSHNYILLGFSIATLPCFIVITVSEVHSLLFLGWSKFLSNLRYIVLFMSGILLPDSIHGSWCWICCQVENFRVYHCRLWSCLCRSSS